MAIFLPAPCAAPAFPSGLQSGRAACRRQATIARYARLVPLSEISAAKNEYNLNLPRYIDSADPEDLQDINGHLRGGIPDCDIDALQNFWDVLPGVRGALFKAAKHRGYTQLQLPIADVKAAILAHAEFTVFTAQSKSLLTKWQRANVAHLTGIGAKTKPKALIDTIAESLLATFEKAPLLDAYAVYQHLMDYWAETMQDDCYLIADAGWQAGAQPRELFKVKGQTEKFTWPKEAGYYEKSKRRFKSDLVPTTILIARTLAVERDAIAALEAQLASVEQQLDETREEHSGEDGLLTDVFAGETDEEKEKKTQTLLKARKVNAKARLKEIGRDPDFVDERQALEAYAKLLDQQTDAKTRLKTAQDDLEAQLDAKYPQLTEDEIKTLVVDDKWLATLAAAVQGELDRVSQTLTGRIRHLAERYATPLPLLTDEVATLAARVDEHLKKMGAVWK